MNSSTETSGQNAPKPLSGAMVNASVSGSDADVNATGVINWMISPPSSLQNKEGRKLLLGFIAGVFLSKREELGYTVKISNDAESKLMPEVLMGDVGSDGFAIEVNSSFGVNTLHPASLEGAGRSLRSMGNKPFLMLLCLQERFSAQWPDVTVPLVQFCDEWGNTIDFQSNRMMSLKETIDRMGFDFNAFWGAATKIGIAPEQVDLSELNTEVEDFYF
jgi:hypothetical protein